ncbi:MAG: nitroreductase family protein [Bacteroidota bacterium]
MNLKETIEARASIRSYIDEAIPEKDLREIVRLAGLAPSINNSQPWKFLAITDKEMLQKMAEEVIKSIAGIPASKTRVANNIKSQVAWYSSFFEEAPVLIALASQAYDPVLAKGVSMDPKEINAKRNFPDIQSVGACIQNLLLAATSLGYGSCWLSGPLFAREKLEKMLEITEPWSLMTFVALGKTKHAGKPKPKRNLGDELIIL